MFTSEECCGQTNRWLATPMTDSYTVRLSTISDDKLNRHINRLCLRNLKSNRVKCCAQCPFEPIILQARPDLGHYFALKKELAK